MKFADIINITPTSGDVLDIFITEDEYIRTTIAEVNGDTIVLETDKRFFNLLISESLLETAGSGLPVPVDSASPIAGRSQSQKDQDPADCMIEAEYQGRNVPLGKPMRGDVKKFKVYVKNPQGNVVKVNFGHGGSSARRAGQKTMKIKKSNPDRRRSFRARHNCDNPGPRHKARYWSCRAW